MRSLLDIVESAKNGERPDPDECYYAMLALSALHVFAVQDFVKIHATTEDKSLFGIKWRAEEAFNRGQKAFGVSPKEYVGWSHDPANPEYQKMRRLAGKIYDKAVKKDA